METENFGGLRRTRRNLLAAGGLLAGAALSQLGNRRANAQGAAPPAAPPKQQGNACFLRGTRLLT